MKYKKQMIGLIIISLMVVLFNGQANGIKTEDNPQFGFESFVLEEYFYIQQTNATHYNISYPVSLDRSIRIQTVNSTLNITLTQTETCLTVFISRIGRIIEVNSQSGNHSFIRREMNITLTYGITTEFSQTEEGNTTTYHFTQTTGVLKANEPVLYYYYDNASYTEQVNIPWNDYVVFVPKPETTTKTITEEINTNITETETVSPHQTNPLNTISTTSGIVKKELTTTASIGVFIPLIALVSIFFLRKYNH